MFGVVYIFFPTECAFVRCHNSGHYTMDPPTNYNIVVAVQVRWAATERCIRPFILLAFRLDRQLSIGTLGRLLDRKAQRKLMQSP